MSLSTGPNAPYPMMCLAVPCACGSEEECGCVPSALVGADGHHYCVNCVAPVERFCLQCGCSDTYGCPEGCTWIEGELRVGQELGVNIRVGCLGFTEGKEKQPRHPLRLRADTPLTALRL